MTSAKCALHGGWPGLLKSNSLRSTLGCRSGTPFEEREIVSYLSEYITKPARLNSEYLPMLYEGKWYDFPNILPPPWICQIVQGKFGTWHEVQSEDSTPPCIQRVDLFGCYSQFRHRNLIGIVFSMCFDQPYTWRCLMYFERCAISTTLPSQRSIAFQYYARCRHPPRIPSPWPIQATLQRTCCPFPT